MQTAFKKKKDKLKLILKLFLHGFCCLLILANLNLIPFSNHRLANPVFAQYTGDNIGPCDGCANGGYAAATNPGADEEGAANGEISVGPESAGEPDAATGETDAAFDNTDGDHGESSTTISPPSVPEYISNTSCFNGVPVQFSWRPTTNTAFYNVTRADTTSATVTGLLGRYYDTKDLGLPMFTRIDQGINFGSSPSIENWGLGAPRPTGATNAYLNPDTFSVRWTGKIKPPFTGNYDFKVESDGGVRFYIDEQRIVKDWSGGKNGTIKTYVQNNFPMDKTKTYNIRLEYFNNENISHIKLYWVRPTADGAAQSFPEIIPQAQLTPSFSNNIINPTLLPASQTVPSSTNYGTYDIPQLPVSSPSPQSIKMINKNDSTQAGDGLYAEYFDNNNFEDTPSKFKIEPNSTMTNFNLADSSGSDSVVDYLDPVVNPTVFSATYRGKILAAEQGTYTFTIRAKDRVRLHINKPDDDGKVVDGWQDTAGVRYVSGTVDLQANQAYDMKLERTFNGGDGTLQLFWNTPNGTAPNGNPSTNGTLIPVSRFYHQFNTTFNQGLQGQYYDNNKFFGAPVATRTDDKVDFANPVPNPAGAWLPSSGGLTIPNISARWTGKLLTAPDTDPKPYQFKVSSSGTGKLFVDKKEILNFSPPVSGFGTQTSSEVNLEPNQLYDIKLEFKDSSANPRIELRWVRPNGTNEIIPPLNLSHHNSLLKSSLLPGLMARYYDNLKNTGHTFSKEDTTLNWDFGANSPDTGGTTLGTSTINPDTFTIRWNGKIKASAVPPSGDYTYFFDVNDGVKFYGDKKLINSKYKTSSGDTTQSISGKINMSANKTSDFRIEYLENIGQASFNSFWQPPLAQKASIPASQMFHGTINTGTITFQDSPPGSGAFAYQVTAVGSGGNTSSTWLTVESGAGACSSAPTLQAVLATCDQTNPSQTEVRLDWTPITGASNYRVYRINPDTTTTIFSPAGNSTHYEDGTIAVGSNYTYYVQAQVSGTWGLFSNQIASGTIQACSPGPQITFDVNQCYTSGPATENGSWIQTSPPAQPIKFYVYDPDYPLSDATAKFTIQRNPSAPTGTPAPFSNNFAYPPASPIGTSQTFGRSFTQAELSGLTNGTGNQYEITAYICNTNSPPGPRDCAKKSDTFDYLSNCIAPWIQTQDGGIHSNQDINFSPSGP